MRLATGGGSGAGWRIGLTRGFAGGCFTAIQQREELLKKQALMFNDDWRWARWEAMATSMPREDAVAFQRRVQAIDEQLVLADYQVTEIAFDADKQGANVSAWFEWYLKRDPTVRKTTVVERWEQRDGQWLVVKIRRTRGDRFGLVTEPAAVPVVPDGGRGEAVTPMSTEENDLRPLGRTGAQVLAVSLGGEGVLRTTGRAREAVPVILEALRLGVRYCDTAPAYQQSQDYYGAAFREAGAGARDQVFLASKVHLRTRDQALRLLDDSLRRLGTDHLDLWQMHDLRDQDDLDGIFGRGGALEAAVQRPGRGPRPLHRPHRPPRPGHPAGGHAPLPVRQPAGAR